MREYSLSISGISLRLHTEQTLLEKASYLPFRDEQCGPEFEIFFHQVGKLPHIPEKVIHEDSCYRVHPDGNGGWLKSFFDAPQDMTPYAAASYDYERKKIQIDYLQKGAHCVSELRNCFFHLDLESLLIHNDRLCLHASCIETQLGGILFSGPSGIGKSTQADLWCKYRNARQINGDRPILAKEKTGWRAWGSPYAGSSRCHVNDSCPVTAIVMLRQEKECSLRRLTMQEAFRAIWSGLTVHSWDPYFVETASDLALDLVQKVPVFSFGCTPDQNAVDYLEQALRKECSL